MDSFKLQKLESSCEKLFQAINAYEKSKVPLKLEIQHNQIQFIVFQKSICNLN